MDEPAGLNLEDFVMQEDPPVTTQPSAIDAKHLGEIINEVS